MSSDRVQVRACSVLCPTLKRPNFEYPKSLSPSMSSDSEAHSSASDPSSKIGYTYFLSPDFLRRRGQFLILLSQDAGGFVNILRRLHEKQDISRFALLSCLITSLSKYVEDVTSPPPEFHALMHSGMLVLLVEILTEKGTYPMSSDTKVIAFRTSITFIHTLQAFPRTLGLRLAIALC